jgi:hypothetical protein
MNRTVVGLAVSVLALLTMRSMCTDPPTFGSTEQPGPFPRVCGGVDAAAKSTVSVSRG